MRCYAIILAEELDLRILQEDCTTELVGITKIRARFYVLISVIERDMVLYVIGSNNCNLLKRQNGIWNFDVTR